MPDMQRKLATIVALDVAGYSALTEADEARAQAAVHAVRRSVEDVISRHGGRLFNTAGDGFMLEFASSASAVEAALELASTCEPKVRVGVHLGDVSVQPNGDLLGHGVNVAARLMAQSTPGSILVSADVRRTIRGPVGAQLVSRGTFKLDKMAETIEAFSTGGVAHAVVHAAPKTATPVLAVLPFDNLSNDPEMQFFSDGVAEEILQLLMRSSGIKVIGRHSAFQFRGAAKANAARELKATHILDGAVRKSGVRMRVNAQLTEASSGAAMWGDRFDREIADAFALQDDIAEKVASALHQTLIIETPAQRIDPIAYELYLKARPLATLWGPEPAREAIALLEQVVAREPGFAQAWALLAAARAFLLPAHRDSVGEPGHNAAVAAANRALALDPKCAEAYRALAMLKPAFAEHGEKMRLIETAYSLMPDDPIIGRATAIAYISIGRLQDSFDAGEKVARADPMLSPFQISNRATSLINIGRGDEGFAALEDAWQRSPGEVSVWYARWITFVFAGRIEEANAMCAPGNAALPHLPPGAIEFLRGVMDTLRADPEMAKTRLREMLSPPVSIRVALLAGAAGYSDLAFDRMNEALDRGADIAAQPMQTMSAGIARAYTCADFFHFPKTPFRQNPRFAKLCARLGLAQYWHDSGRWPDCTRETPYNFKDECVKALRDPT